MDEFKDLKAEREIQIGKTTRCPLGWWLESKRKGYQALVRTPTKGCPPESPVKCGPAVLETTLAASQEAKCRLSLRPRHFILRHLTKNK